jgi:hypothetical protein
MCIAPPSPIKRRDGDEYDISLTPALSLWERE